MASSLPEKGIELRAIEKESLPVLDPQSAAESVDLAYVSDQEPGIRRRRHGKRFRYIAPDGSVVTDPSDLARIKALAIPPAWDDVWIAPDPAGHIQASGRDQKGRKQYRYHPDWIACRDEAKFSSLASFARSLPPLRARVEADLRKRSLSRERVIAAVVSLLDDTMIRIGNESYARDNRSFGLTTLRRRHVAVDGAELRFAFKGKSGQEWNLKLTDRRVASVLRSLQELRGQRLFKYLDELGEAREVHSQDVNAYIQEAMGAEFSSKHFRTWYATISAAFALASVPLPETKRAQTRTLNACIDKVARQLRNTRAVCRRCYVHPGVPESWLEGRLDKELAEIRRSRRRPLKGLDREEAILLVWLETYAS